MSLRLVHGGENDGYLPDLIPQYSLRLTGVAASLFGEVIWFPEYESARSVATVIRSMCDQTGDDYHIQMMEVAGKDERGGLSGWGRKNGDRYNH